MESVFQVQRHLWICVCLAVFNAADALFTHRLLLKGGTELNPIMNALYMINPILFLFVKFLFSYLIFIIGFVPLMDRVKTLLYIALTLYTLVVIWHLILNILLFS
ncbi:DUF5658 family protein [Fictibacillus sp. BK138]|uniref:DUF5658 family protein n=1 Tax=Fictibacillus sp. BK138 TaxID=2512121 RepID=UPI00102A09C6|nr:DUF5658 family protein [Fictibacillus sp. BK138]RZT21576.1 hypothetical protein EV282_0638 [Fictibacillus sp. BK138]